MIAVGFVIGVLFGFLVGATMVFLSAKARIATYRKRWETATNVIQTLEEGKPAPKAKQTKAIESPKTELSTKELLKLDGWDRVALEKDRLRAGLGPRDPLTGLDGWDVVAIEKARVKYGRAR